MKEQEHKNVSGKFCHSVFSIKHKSSLRKYKSTQQEDNENNGILLHLCNVSSPYIKQ